MKQTIVAISAAAFFVGAPTSRAGAVIDVVGDLLELFKPSMALGASECNVRRPASAGGVKQPALFQHPAGTSDWATVTYALELPVALPGEVVLLCIDTALADGMTLRPADDGVRFSVQIGAERVLNFSTREQRWRHHTVDLTSFAGGRVTLALVVDANGNNANDWAVWGNPRVLHFRNLNESQRGYGETNTPPNSPGALLVRRRPGTDFTVRVKPNGDGAPAEIKSAQAPTNSGSSPWLVQDFEFPSGPSGTVEWEPKSALTPNDIFVAAYVPLLRIGRPTIGRALPFVNDVVPLRVEVKNEGRGKLASGQARVGIRVGSDAPPEMTVPELGPGESFRAEWKGVCPPTPGGYGVQSRLNYLGADSAGGVAVLRVRPKSEKRHTIESEHIKMDFAYESPGFAYANVFARQGTGWTQVAVWRPLFQTHMDFKPQGTMLDFRPDESSLAPQRFGREKLAVHFVAHVPDPDGGITWDYELSVRLETNAPLARIHYAWRTSADRNVNALWGPNFYVGEGTLGEAKTWGLFPGLEYLYGPERSSNPRDFTASLADRRTPHPHKITAPIMAVTLGPESRHPPDSVSRFFAPDSLKDRPSALSRARQIATSLTELEARQFDTNITVALWWNPLQRWDGKRTFPSPRFSSPNIDEGMANHRLGLFVPSVPDFLEENSDTPTKPLTLVTRKAVTLDATLMVAPGPALVAMREWIKDTRGLPKPTPWPRPFQEALDVCRAGFLQTVWDTPQQKWRHCIDWASGHAPGFAALLYVDSHVAEKPDARRASRERVDLVVTNMLRDGGPASLTSANACHIMRWELPFLYGHLPEAIAGAEENVRRLIQSQDPTGGWRYEPGSGQATDLGQAGDSVLGTSAHHAATVLRFARITGDTAALAAGEKALKFMEQFRVPRGGQTWECPMYEPDILAAAYAVQAYHDGYRATGNPRWLNRAVYWAETGVPFIYLWGLREKPMMLGATIPVFGSTFYSHSWLATPVQWCGLVYAYHVFHLAEELERTTPPPDDASPTLALQFTPADWKRIVELITSSALHQQFATGDKIGAYPDSISNFDKRNPAFLNPEDILVNLLALRGHDPDIQTARAKTERGDVVVSSGARISGLQANESGARFELKFFAGEPSHSVIAGCAPREVRVDGQPLPPSPAPLGREPGWWWDERTQRLYLCVPHPAPSASVEVQRKQ